jgi:hypothetical protein
MANPVFNGLTRLGKPRRVFYGLHGATVVERAAKQRSNPTNFDIARPRLPVRLRQPSYLSRMPDVRNRLSDIADEF